MKSLAILVLAVLVSAGSSAAVTQKLITSKDIKNGTIRPIDLSLEAKNLNKLRKVTVRDFVPFSYASTGPKTVTVSCPPGTVVLSGGFSSAVDGPPARIVIKRCQVLHSRT